MAKSFISEFKRRNVFKVGVAYLVLAWVVIQVTSEAVPALHLPEWVNSFVFFAGAIGFPFAIFFAWIFEITPDGIKKESDIRPEDSISAHTGRKLDYIIIAMLIMVAGYFIYESRFTSDQNISNTNTDANHNLIDASIAVLPFINMSSDKEQDYFSDGITEEILNVLANIPQLQVTSRSSAFAYKGKEINISKVAKELGVKNILEGSVRKSGTRVRITAQLINASTDKHLWSKTYDRELDDIFKVQDEISAAIVDALKDKLGIELVRKKYKAHSINPQAYDLYLQGLKELHDQSFNSLEKAVKKFESALKIAPSFTLAKLLLAESYVTQVNTGSRYDLEILDSADKLMKEILIDTPDSAAAFLNRSLIAHELNNNELEGQYAKKAYQLNPNNADVITLYASNKSTELGVEETKKLYKRAIKIDPLNARIYYRYANYLINVVEDYSEAEKAYQQAIKLNPNNPNYNWYYGVNLISKSDVVQGLKLMERAQQLDKKDPDYLDVLSLIELSLGDVQKAKHYSDEAIALNPHYARSVAVKASLLIVLEQEQQALNLLMDSLASPETEYRFLAKENSMQLALYILMKGQQYEIAERLINQHYPKLAALVNEPLPKTAKDIQNVPIIGLLSMVYQGQHKFEAANHLNERLKLAQDAPLKFTSAYRQDIQLAGLSAVINNDDQALNYLESAAEDRPLVLWRTNIEQSPYLISLHQHPRYIALIKRIKSKMAEQRAMIESKEMNSL